MDLLRRCHEKEMDSADSQELKRLHADCLAACYWRLKLWPEAANYLEKLDPKPDHASARALAYAYYQMAKAWISILPARAIELWRAIDELAPDSDMAHELAIQSLQISREQAFRAWGAGKSEEVIHFASVVVDIARDWSRAEFIYLLIDAYVRLDRFEEAAEVVGKLLDVLPGNVLAQLMYGILLLATDDLRTAREYLIPLAHDTGHPAAKRALKMVNEPVADIRQWVHQELSEALDEAVRHLLKGIQDHRWERDRTEGSVKALVYKGPRLPEFSWWIVMESADRKKLTALLNQLMNE